MMTVTMLQRAATSLYATLTMSTDATLMTGSMCSSGYLYASSDMLTAGALRAPWKHTATEYSSGLSSAMYPSRAHQGVSSTLSMVTGTLRVSSTSTGAQGPLLAGPLALLGHSRALEGPRARARRQGLRGVI